MNLTGNRLIINSMHFCIMPESEDGCNEIHIKSTENEDYRKIFCTTHQKCDVQKKLHSDSNKMIIIRVLKKNFQQRILRISCRQI